MKAISKFLNRTVKPADWNQNEFIPAVAVDDAKRKQWFTTYNVDLMNRIRDIKLNELK